MTALSDLKTRIIAETTRDDLADDYAVNLQQAITEAIQFYAPQRFWFNEEVAVGQTVAGSNNATPPAGIEWIDDILVMIGAGYSLQKMQLAQIQHLLLIGTSGQPFVYAENDAGGVRNLVLWPKPSQVWNLQYIGTADQGALVLPTDTNDWLTYAYDLITAHAKLVLCRDLFRDDLKMQTAQAAEDMALRRLRAETGRRLGTGRIAPKW